MPETKYSCIVQNYAWCNLTSLNIKRICISPVSLFPMKSCQWFPSAKPRSGFCLVLSFFLAFFSFFFWERLVLLWGKLKKIDHETVCGLHFGFLYSCIWRSSLNLLLLCHNAVKTLWKSCFLMKRNNLTCTLFQGPNYYRQPHGPLNGYCLIK